MCTWLDILGKFEEQAHQEKEFSSAKGFVKQATCQTYFSPTTSCSPTHFQPHYPYYCYYTSRRN